MRSARCVTRRALAGTHDARSEGQLAVAMLLCPGSTVMQWCCHAQRKRQLAMDMARIELRLCSAQHCLWPAESACCGEAARDCGFAQRSERRGGTSPVATSGKLRSQTWVNLHSAACVRERACSARRRLRSRHSLCMRRPIGLACRRKLTCIYNDGLCRPWPCRPAALRRIGRAPDRCGAHRTIHGRMARPS